MLAACQDEGLLLIGSGPTSVRARPPLTVTTAEVDEAIGYDDEPYDALLQEFEPGLTTAEVADTFGTLRADLVPLVEQVAAADQVADDILASGGTTQRDVLLDSNYESSVQQSGLNRVKIDDATWVTSVVDGRVTVEVS